MQKKNTDNKIRLYLNVVPRTLQKDWKPLRPSYFSFHLDSFVFGNIFKATPSQVLIACMAGVSNSNLSEGHILKKCSTGCNLLEKNEIYKKTHQNTLYLVKIYNFVVLGDVRGPAGRVFETPAKGRCFLMTVAIVIMKEIKKCLWRILQICLSYR